MAREAQGWYLATVNQFKLVLLLIIGYRLPQELLKFLRYSVLYILGTEKSPTFSSITEIHARLRADYLKQVCL
jgi:hypothetical protein